MDVLFRAGFFGSDEGYLVIEPEVRDAAEEYDAELDREYKKLHSDLSRLCS